MSDALLEDGATRRHHASELEHEVDDHRNAQGDPTETCGEAIHDGHRGEDGPGDLKGSEADVGHAILRKSAGLQLRVHDLEDGDTGGHGSGGPAPTKDAALDPALAEELRREPDKEAQ